MPQSDFDHALLPQPGAAVNPLAVSVRGDEPVTASTAILMCIRNEALSR